MISGLCKSLISSWCKSFFLISLWFACYRLRYSYRKIWFSQIWWGDNITVWLDKIQSYIWDLILFCFDNKRHNEKVDYACRRVCSWYECFYFLSYNHLSFLMLGINLDLGLKKLRLHQIGREVCVVLLATSRSDISEKKKNSSDLMQVLVNYFPYQ